MKVGGRTRSVLRTALCLSLVAAGLSQIVEPPALASVTQDVSLGATSLVLPASPSPLTDVQRMPVMAPVNPDGIPADSPRVVPGKVNPTSPAQAVAGAQQRPFEGSQAMNAFAQTPASGTHIALVYAGQANEQAAGGKWKSVALGLTATTGGWTATNDGISVFFPATLSVNAPITTTLPQGSVAIAPVGVSATGSSDGITLTYANALPSVDLVYRAIPGGYQEQVVFKDSSASSKISYAISASGLTLSRSGGGGLDVLASGTAVGWIPAPIAYDSSPEPVGSVPATSFVDLGGGSYTLGLALDASFMSSATYPVILDPSPNKTFNPSRDGYTDQANPDTSYEGSGYLKVDSGKNSFLRFDISAIQKDNRLVYDSTLFLYPTATGGVSGGIDAKRVTASWPAAGNLTWNTQPAVGSTVFDNASSASNDGWWHWQLKALYQHYVDTANTYNTNWTDYGLRLSASAAKTFNSSETTTAGAQPVIYITYNDLPGAPTANLPDAGYVSETLSPTLSVKGGADWPSDPNGDDTLVNFQISDDGVSWTGTHLVYQSPFNDVRSFTVPAGVLTDGQQYWWRAQSADICSPPEGICSSIDGAGTDHGYKNTAARGFTVTLKHLGEDQRYSMWSKDAGSGMTMKVNESSGNLFLDVPLDSYQTPIGGLDVGLTYNSLQNANYGLGPGWDLGIGPSGSARSLPVELVKLETGADSDIKIRFRDGSTLFFPHKDGNVYGATGASSGFVRRAQDNSWTYVDADGGVFTFLPGGKLDKAMPSSMSPSASGNKSIDYTYDTNNHLTRVKDPLGRGIDLSWNASGQLSTITATGFGGQTWTLAYDAAPGKLVRIWTTVAAPAGTNNTHTEVLDFGYQGGTGTGAGLVSSVKNGQIQGQGTSGTSSTAGWTITYQLVTGDATSTVRVAGITAPDGNATSAAPAWHFGYAGPFKGTTAAITCIADPRTTTPTACDADYADGPYETQVESNWAGLPIRITRPPDQNGYRQVLTYLWDSNDNMLCERSAAANALGGVHCMVDTSGNTDLGTDGLSTVYTYDSDPPYRMLTVTRPAPDASGYPRLKESYAYDGGSSFTGLWMETYSNAQMTGLPSDERVWNDFNYDWAGGAPTGASGADYWSVRWTGWLNVPAKDWYSFRVWSEDGVNLTIGDKTLISCFGTETSALDYNCGSNQDVKKHLWPGLQPITIEYSALTGPASFKMKWDQGQSVGTWVVTPPSLFQPDLGIVTTKTYSKVTSGATTDLFTEDWTYPDDDAKARRLPATYQRTDLTQSGPSYKTSYGYNSWGQTTSLTTAAGTSLAASTTSTYTNGTPTFAGWPGGQVSCLTKVVGPSGEQTDYECNTAGDQTKMTQTVAATASQPAQTRVTSTAYDSLGRVVLLTPPSAGTVSSTYDLAGRLTQTDQLVQTGVDAVSTNTWDAAGRLTQVQGPDPDGASPYANRPTTTYVYDWADNRDQMTDPLGKVWTYDQDGLDRQTSVRSPLGASTTTNYRLGATENRVVVTDPAGVADSTALDVLARSTSETIGSLSPTTYGYDVLGNQTLVTDPAGIQTKSVFDNLSELTQKVQFNGTAAPASTVYTYDAAGMLSQLDGPRSDVDDRLQYTYDLSRRMTSVTQPGVTLPSSATPASVSLTYDNAGERVRVAQPMTSTQTFTRDFTYDTSGNLATSADARGQSTYTHNLAGWLTQTADPRPQSVYLGYDALGRRVCRYTSACTASTTGAETYAFDAAGHTTQAKNASVTYNMTYDADGRLYQAKRGTSVETTYTYNAGTARLTSITDAA
ncbi:MAG: hypothetical protein HY240_01735, partial [Actinobacteria bacterium]|nr:hypothetical protein [Actinomycetota bacterium]